MIITLSFLFFYISFYIFERFKFGNFKYIKLNESFKDFIHSFFLTAITLIFFYFYPINIFSINIHSSAFIESNIVYYVSLILFIFTVFKILIMYKYHFNIKNLDNTEYLNRLQINILKSLYSFSPKTKIFSYETIFKSNYILYKNNNLEILMTNLESDKSFFNLVFDNRVLEDPYFQKMTIENILEYYDMTARTNGYSQNLICVKNLKNSKLLLLTKKDLQLMGIDDLTELSLEKLSLLEILKI
ncbi:MAG: hypothetical protein K2X69_06370 [Silvanigrellaceae bacterium]|nr:hypothetical protein [Silvanigrellaceae bacterium]